jgi:hypothetical protein
LVTKDPIPGGNPYAYAGNDPVRYVDPGGLCIPGYNCPPGQGGGIFPPFLPISKEGGHFGQLYRLCRDYGCFITDVYAMQHMACLPAPPGQPLTCVWVDGGVSSWGTSMSEAVSSAVRPVVEWVEEHRDEILYGTAVAGGCVTMFYPLATTGPTTVTLVVGCGGAGVVAGATGYNPFAP